MKEQRIMIDLPAELWRKVSIAAATEAKTKKEYVAQVLQNEIIRRGDNDRG